MCKHVHVLFVVYSGIAYVLVVFLKILRYQRCYLTLELSQEIDQIVRMFVCFLVLDPSSLSLEKSQGTLSYCYA